MAGLQIFDSAEFGKVRIVDVNDTPYFIGKDVCNAFGDTNHNRSLSRIDDEDKCIVDVVDNLGRVQKATAINESGLYTLLFTMQPKRANNDGVTDAYPIEVQERIDKVKRFKRWVTSEVLPSIARHGMYAIDDIVNNPDLGIAILTQLKVEREKAKELQLTVAIKDQQIAEMKPKASYFDAVMQCKDAIPITIIAKDYGWSASKMNQFLKKKGVQYNLHGVWLLYQKYSNCGYTVSKPNVYTDSLGVQHTRMHTYWLQKGRLFIYDLLKADGILPIIERVDTISIDDLQPYPYPYGRKK